MPFTLRHIANGGQSSQPVDVNSLKEAFHLEKALLSFIRQRIFQTKASKAQFHAHTFQVLLLTIS